MNNGIKYRQDGATLIELIISMVVISIALVGIFTVINLTSTTSANPVVQYQAIAIGESYMEEILLQAYCDPNISATCAVGMGTGPDSGEGRATYNDVDDFNGLNNNGAYDSQGNAITSLSAYKISVTVVENQNVAGLTAKLITVTVTGSGIPAIVLTGYTFLAG